MSAPEPAPEIDRGLLRFLTCGSVDDGKSTLIGRLLYDTKAILADQLHAIARTSERRGLAEPDLSLLTDGLQAEREQGITIDVAYRYFSTGTRKFIIADAPGHEQYTRNMVTAASTANLAIILVDARKGILTQTRGTPIWPIWSASPTWWWPSTRWTWWTTTWMSSTASAASIWPSPSGSASAMSASSPCRPCAGTWSWSAAIGFAGTADPPCWSCWRPPPPPTPSAPSPSASRSSTSADRETRPTRTCTTTAAIRGEWSPGRSPWATRSPCCRPVAPARSRPSRSAARPSPGPSTSSP